MKNNRPIDLSSAGINSYGWPIDNTADLLKWLQRHTSVVVLGGDFILSKDNKIEHLHENWSYQGGGSVSSAHNESISKALDVVSSFDSKKYANHSVYVDLVIKP